MLVLSSARKWNPSWCRQSRTPGAAVGSPAFARVDKPIAKEAKTVTTTKNLFTPVTTAIL